MVKRIIGNPAGQWAIHDGVVAILSYFNGPYADREPDGYICMLLVNTTHEERVIEIGLSFTYSGDVFFDHLRFREILAPGVVVERECYREQLKLATWAMVSFYDREAHRWVDRFTYKAMETRLRAESERDPSPVADRFTREDPKWQHWLEHRKEGAAALPPYEPDSLTVIEESFEKHDLRIKGLE